MSPFGALRGKVKEGEKEAVTSVAQERRVTSKDKWGFFLAENMIHIDLSKMAGIR